MHPALRYWWLFCECTFLVKFIQGNNAIFQRCIFFMEQCGRVSELVHGGFITSHNGDKKVIYPSENKYGRDDLEEEVSKEFLAPTLEESYISECLRASLSLRIVQFSLYSCITQHLILWLSWNLVHLTTLGYILWCWCQNSCQLSSAVNSCFFYFAISENLC